jgi:hypothetical protein
MTIVMFLLIFWLPFRPLDSGNDPQKMDVETRVKLEHSLKQLNSLKMFTSWAVIFCLSVLP